VHVEFSSFQRRGPGILQVLVASQPEYQEYEAHERTSDEDAEQEGLYSLPTSTRRIVLNGFGRVVENAHSRTSDTLRAVGHYIVPSQVAFGRTSAWLTLPAQPVVATPSSALIRQYLRGGTISLAALGQNLARTAF
jgi:hypothetical protein